MTNPNYIGRSLGLKINIKMKNCPFNKFYYYERHFIGTDFYVHVPTYQTNGRLVITYGNSYQCIL